MKPSMFAFWGSHWLFLLKLRTISLPSFCLDDSNHRDKLPWGEQRAPRAALLGGNTTCLSMCHGWCLGAAMWCAGGVNSMPIMLTTKCWFQLLVPSIGAFNFGRGTLRVATMCSPSKLKLSHWIWIIKQHPRFWKNSLGPITHSNPMHLSYQPVGNHELLLPGDFSVGTGQRQPNQSCNW